MRYEPISNAKNNLSAVLKSVAGGESVIITDRGTPIARLEPIHSRPDGERLQSLVDRGLIRTAGRSADVLPRPIALPAGASLLEALLEDREASR